MQDLPSNWEHPDWHKTYEGGKCHNWLNHVPLPIRDIWGTFSREQKMHLAAHFEDLAQREVWE